MPRSKNTTSTSKRKIKPTFTVVRDTREQKGWYFDLDTKSGCLGTVEKGLATGDYSLVGYEDVFAIERKATTGEFAQNATQGRFEDELKRLALLPRPYVILEFAAEDFELFPATSTIPRHLWGRLKIRPDFLWKRLVEMMSDHKVPFLFAGNNGAHLAMTVMKWVLANVSAPKKPEESDDA